MLRYCVLALPVLFSGPPIPSYARETLSSHQHSQQDETESQPFESPGSKESLEYSISVSEDSREKEFEVDKPVPMVFAFDVLMS